jgi:hypothetical protein
MVPVWQIPYVYAKHSVFIRILELIKPAYFFSSGIPEI